MKENPPYKQDKEAQKSAWRKKTLKALIALPIKRQRGKGWQINTSEKECFFMVKKGSLDLHCILYFNKQGYIQFKNIYINDGPEINILEAIQQELDNTLTECAQAYNLPLADEEVDEICATNFTSNIPPPMEEDAPKGVIAKVRNLLGGK